MMMMIATSSAEEKMKKHRCNDTVFTTAAAATFNNNNNGDDDDDDDDNYDDSLERRNLRFLQSPHCSTNCVLHVRPSGLGAIMCTCNTLSACHVHMQHIERLSCAHATY